MNDNNMQAEVVRSENGRAPLADGVADRLFMINVLHHVYDEPDVLEEILRLLAPGGILVDAEFARMDRPVGPPNDHVLALADVRATLTGLGLHETAVYQPGEVGRYHIAVVAQKPKR